MFDGHFSQSLQTGQSSFVMRCKRIKRECPIRVLVITISSCLNEDEESFHEAIDVLISLSLIVFGVSSHLFFQ